MLSLQYTKNTGNIYILPQFSLPGEHVHSPIQCLLQLYPVSSL